MRSEIQALRALAISLVVANHVWPQRVSGGFVGVDVFFVVSGFLISSHLIREYRVDGRVDVPQFWARRLRRLLPAAILVLAVTFVLVVAVFPVTAWSINLVQIGASALYAENWSLIAASTDYFALETAPTAVRHYWSLSVEEQFYLLWPLLIAAVGWLSQRGRAKTHSLRSLKAAVLLVAAVSLAASVMQTDSGSGSSAAYFSTLTRAWEFMVGAMIAIAPGLTEGVAESVPRRFRAILAWGGYAMILCAAVLYTAQTPFPGAAATLPVMGAALVLVAGAPRSRFAPNRIVGIAPVQWLGGISYSLYLWHWPLLIAAPYLLVSVGGLTSMTRLLVVAVAIALAYATKRLVEDRFRYRGSSGASGRTAMSTMAARSWSRRPPARRQIAGIPVAGTFALAAAASAGMVAAVAGVDATLIAPRVEATAARLLAAQNSGCFGADSVRNSCEDPFGPADTVDPLHAIDDRVPLCMSGVAPGSSLATCAHAGRGQQSVAVIGDSHAQIMGRYVAKWAADAGRSYREYTRGSCPGIVGPPSGTIAPGVHSDLAKKPSELADCVRWSSAVMDEVARDTDISVVIVSNATRQYVDADGRSPGILSASHIESVFASLQRRGKTVVVIRDVPGLAFGTTAPACVSRSLDDPGACDLDKEVAVPDADPMVRAASRVSARVVDLSDLLCDDRDCHAVVGGVIGYWDRAHLTQTMADSLAPTLRDRLTSAMATTGP